MSSRSGAPSATTTWSNTTACGRTASGATASSWSCSRAATSTRRCQAGTSCLGNSASGGKCPPECGFNADMPFSSCVISCPQAHHLYILRQEPLGKAPPPRHKRCSSFASTLFFLFSLFVVFCLSHQRAPRFATSVLLLLGLTSCCGAWPTRQAARCRARAGGPPRPETPPYHPSRRQNRKRPPHGRQVSNHHQRFALLATEYVFFRGVSVGFRGAFLRPRLVLTASANGLLCAGRRQNFPILVSQRWSRPSPR